MRRTLLFALLLLAVATAPARSQQQVEDTTFVPKVAKPAFTGRHPVVMIDEAHGNHFTRNGLYRAFASLLSQDGLNVISGGQAFSPQLLKACQVLVVADALGTKDLNGPAARANAIRIPECDVVRDWVKEGGSLLLIADHAPFASAMDSLAVRFGVDHGQGLHGGHAPRGPRDREHGLHPLHARPGPAGRPRDHARAGQDRAHQPGGDLHRAVAGGPAREHGPPGTQPFGLGPALQPGRAARGHPRGPAEGRHHVAW